MDLFDPKSLPMDQPRLIILINAAATDKTTKWSEFLSLHCEKDVMQVH